MPSLTKLAFAAAAAAISIPSVLAVPNVTVVPAAGGCSSFPDSYDSTTGLTSGFIFVLQSAGNSTMEGWGDTSRFQVTNSSTVARFTFPDRIDLAKTHLRCNDALPAPHLEAWLTASPSATTASWNQVNSTIIAGDQVVGWGFGQDSSEIGIYNHFIGEVDQGGLYLGVGGQTTFALKGVAATAGARALWDVRVLGEDGVRVGEWTSFIKVYGS